MSPEAVGIPADLPPEEWYAQAERAFQVLKNRLAHAEREVGRREHDLEMRERDLADGEQRLEERRRSLDTASREVVAKAGAVAMESRVLAADRQALERERAALEATRRTLDEARAQLEAKEASLQAIERDLAERNLQVAQAQRDVETLQSGHEVAYAAARDEIVKAHETLWEQARSSGAELPPKAPSPSSLEEALERVLALREVMETAASAAHDREERANALLAEATLRAQEIQSFEGRVRDEEARLASLKAEVVTAKQALLVVDAALARMPYDVVDDFTRSAEFDAYEKAVKALRRIPEG